jgi:hypothetical protein|tara:strand:- start:3917 stop:4297 length:381 start_codon:yes stop_codon:yes gene_type:complete
MINIPVSLGEVIDKLSILSIKKIEIKNKKKLIDINKEYNLLLIIYNKFLNKELAKLYNDIYKINYKLWKIEDDIRDKERNKEFDDIFIELARSVYITNDERMNIKNIINHNSNSDIKEHKSYKPYI